MVQTNPKTERQTDTCRNCGHDVVEKFCSQCGQENTHHVLPLKDLVRDVLDEFVKWDSRLFITLKPLLFRPGFLTTEFLAGRRATYIAPLRLYFIISTVYFLAFSFYSAPQVRQSFVRGGPPTQNAPTSRSAVTSKPMGPKDAERVRVQKILQARFEEGGNWFTDHITTISIFLIPVYAALLHLLYRRSNRLYMEHLVFMLHVQSFAFLISLPTTLGQFMTWNLVINLTVAPAYTWLAARRVYGQGPWKTLVKVVLLTVAEIMVAGMVGILTALYFVLR